jgi:hypothetical protein
VTNNNLNVVGATQAIAVSGIGINTADSTAVAVSASPTTAPIGQPLTLTATVSDTRAGHTSTIPSGGVTFVDTVGSTALSLNGGSAVTLAGGVATLAGVTLHGAGAHTIAANYGGATGTFAAGTHSIALTIILDTETITGPATEPVPVVIGQAGSVTITVAGPYSVVAPPSGSLSFNVLNSSSSSVASGSATLTAGSTSSMTTVPLAGSLPAGNYSVSVSYAGDSNYSASSNPVAIAVVVGRVTPTINWNAPSGITHGASLAAVLTATAANGSNAVPGTFSYTATPTGGSASVVTGATLLSAGAYALAASFIPTDTNTYADTAKTVSLSVAKAGVMVSLSSPASTVIEKTDVTFTAAVSSAAGVPDGIVGFYDGTTLLGSGALSAGRVSYSTSSLVAGAHSITAEYGGSSNFLALTSSALTEKVEDFSLNLASGGTNAATVMPGGTATYSLVVGPTTGMTFPAAVTLAVTGLPSGAKATLTPDSLAEGSASTKVSLTVEVPTLTAYLRHQTKRNTTNLALVLSPTMFGMLLLPFIRPPFAGRAWQSIAKRRRLARLLCLAFLATTLLGLAGCGTKSSGFLGQTSYTLTVTATSGALSHSTTLNLTVQ